MKATHFFIGLLCLSFSSLTARHQEESEEPIFDGSGILDFTLGVIESSIEEGRRKRQLDDLTRVWYATNYPQKDVESISILHYTIPCEFPIDTSGQVLLQTVTSNNEVQLIALVMKDRWVDRDQIQMDHITSMEIQKADWELFLLAFFRANCGVPVHSLDSIPVYREYLNSSGKMRKFKKEIAANGIVQASEHWPLILPNGTKTSLIYQGTVSWNEMVALSKKGFTAIRINAHNRVSMRADFANNEKRAYKSCTVGDYHAIIAPCKSRMGREGMGYFEIDNGLVWYISCVLMPPQKQNASSKN